MNHIRNWAVLFIGLFFLSAVTTAQQTQTYSVSNQTGLTITAVTISPVDANKWSTNLYSKEKLMNNESFEFKQAVDQANCLYDIKFNTEDGKEQIIRSVDLCKSTSISLAVPEKTDQKMEKTEKK